MIRTIVFIIFWFASLVGCAQTTDLLYIFPSKEVYETGEDMWFKAYLMDFIMRQNQMAELQNLTDEEEVIVNQLMEEKYQTWEWNYGKSPEYSMNKKIRTKGGTVQVVADIRDGHIRDLQFFGDFFSEKDPQDLVDQLIGIRLDRQSIADALTNININDYFHNVTHDDIINLLC